MNRNDSEFNVNASLYSDSSPPPGGKAWPLPLCVPTKGWGHLSPPAPEPPPLPVHPQQSLPTPSPGHHADQLLTGCSALPGAAVGPLGVCTRHSRRCVTRENIHELGDRGFGRQIWISEGKDTNKIWVASQVPSPPLRQGPGQGGHTVGALGAPGSWVPWGRLFGFCP